MNAGALVHATATALCRAAQPALTPAPRAQLPQGVVCACKLTSRSAALLPGAARRSPHQLRIQEAGLPHHQGVDVSRGAQQGAQPLQVGLQREGAVSAGGGTWVC